MRMCSLCEAAPVASDGKCSLCLKELAGTQEKPKHGDRRPKTRRGVRVSTPSWAKPKGESNQRQRASQRPD
jgi:hypothetical protein